MPQPKEHSPRKPNPLAAVLNRESLLQMAGERYFDRGEQYFLDGRVVALVEDEGKVSAMVQGTEEYRVTLRAAGETFEHLCTCPLGADGEFCKHCVAVGLAWMEHSETGRRQPSESGGLDVTMNDVREYLSAEDKDTLVKMLIEQAVYDQRLLRQLEMKAAKRKSSGVNVTFLRKAIDRVFVTGGFVHYRAAHGYAQGIEDVVDSLEELLKDGHAGEVVELTEYALAALEKSLGNIDDSDGNMGDIRDRLENLHHAACEKARPDPEALAKRLFELELHSDWEIFAGAVEKYADLLGEKGLTVYRKLAEKEWARVPQRQPDHKDSVGADRHFQITHIMKHLAELSGDVEALVAVKSRDLSHSWDFLDIAETYKKAQKYDLALEWAERGMSTFAERPDWRLREFMAHEYHRRGRHDEAMTLMWMEFTEHPDLRHFEQLKIHADHTGQWPTWREKAIALIRETVARTKREVKKTGSHWSTSADHSELVRIFLWEKDVETAWREAKAGGCHESLWMELATKREKEHPEDTLPIYRRHVDLTLNGGSNAAYEQAIGLMRKVRRLMARLGGEKDFPPYVESIRTVYRRKRNFMKLLEDERW